MLLKRAARGDLALLPAIQSVLAGKGRAWQGADEQARLVQNAKCIALLAIGVAFQKYGQALPKQQEVLMSISDILIEIMAMESILLRSQKLAGSGVGCNARDMTAAYLPESIDRVGLSCKVILGACLEGEALSQKMSMLRDFASYDPIDVIGLRRTIAHRLLAAERYVSVAKS
jgi:hypothetical protein